MRFYNPRTTEIIELRRPAVRLFLLGPLYLAWLRLWRDAVVLGVVIYVLLHGSILATRLAVGEAASGGLPAVWAAFEAFMLATSRADGSMDEAYRALIAASLPYYVAAAVLLVPATVISLGARQYFLYRYRTLGYVPLKTDDIVEAELLQEY